MDSVETRLMIWELGSIRGCACGGMDGETDGSRYENGGPVSVGRW